MKQRRIIKRTSRKSIIDTATEFVTSSSVGKVEIVGLVTAWKGGECKLNNHTYL